jgi:hypothetical protein
MITMKRTNPIIKFINDDKILGYFRQSTFYTYQNMTICQLFWASLGRVLVTAIAAAALWFILLYPITNMLVSFAVSGHAFGFLIDQLELAPEGFAPVYHLFSTMILGIIVGISFFGMLKDWIGGLELSMGRRAFYRLRSQLRQEFLDANQIDVNDWELWDIRRDEYVNARLKEIEAAKWHNRFIFHPIGRFFSMKGFRKAGEWLFDVGEFIGNAYRAFKDATCLFVKIVD